MISVIILGVLIILMLIVIIRKSNKNCERKIDKLTRSTFQYKCFIAGSTSLNSERDAIRAVVSEMHNKFLSKGILITSYTFEDFDNTIRDGGLQNLYNDFIANEADCIIFIIDGRIGHQTLNEFNISIKSYLSRQKPAILVYGRYGSQDMYQSSEFINKLNNLKHYWRIYKDLSSLKQMVREDLFGELFKLL